MATLVPESTRPSLPQLGCAPSIQTHTVSANMPPNRGLERALEEAAASGILNLSSRKLKEYPRTAANHDLTDTVEADLSKNRLVDVPSEVCHLVALETLNLYHNCIRTIPDSIISLQSLTSLNLRCSTSFVSRMEGATEKGLPSETTDFEESPFLNDLSCI